MLVLCAFFGPEVDIPLMFIFCMVLMFFVMRAFLSGRFPCGCMPRMMHRGWRPLRGREGKSQRRARRGGTII